MIDATKCEFAVTYATRYAAMQIKMGKTKLITIIINDEITKELSNLTTLSLNFQKIGVTRSLR